ncbi:biopolymer transporter ExbD [bacterium]|nr:biopolymer transporter ExbD [candidate division CSSED10-310 bacterium]
MRFARETSVRPDLNITPLIDVVLMLLIFFMISTSFIFQPGILIKLPQADHSDSTTPRGASIMITSEGDIYFEKLRTTIQELESQFRQFPDKSVLLIKADQNVAHGIVVQTMNQAKNAGFQRIAIATRPTGD